MNIDGPLMGGGESKNLRLAKEKTVPRVPEEVVISVDSTKEKVY